MAVTSFSGGGGGASDQGGTLVFAAELLSAGCKKEEALSAGVYLLNIYGTGTLTVKTYAGSLNEITSTIEIVVSGEKTQLITLSSAVKGLYFSGVNGYVVVRDWAALPSATLGIVAPATTYFPETLNLLTVPSGASNAYVNPVGNFLWLDALNTTWYSTDGVTWSTISTSGLNVSNPDYRTWQPTVVKDNDYAGTYFYGYYNGYYTINYAITRWNGTSFNALTVPFGQSPYRNYISSSGEQYYNRMVVHSNSIYYYFAATGNAGLYAMPLTYDSYSSPTNVGNWSTNSGLTFYGTEDFTYALSWIPGSSPNQNYMWQMGPNIAGPASRVTITDPNNIAESGSRFLIKNGSTWIKMAKISGSPSGAYYRWTSDNQAPFFGGFDFGNSTNATFPAFTGSMGNFFISPDETTLAFNVRIGTDPNYTYVIWYTTDGLSWSSIATGLPIGTDFTVRQTSTATKYVIVNAVTRQIALTDKNAGSIGVL